MVKNVIYILLAVISAVLCFRYLEHQSLYFPMKEIELTPEAIGLAYEDMYMVTEDDVRLNAWLVLAKDSRYTLLFCHGNGGNISHRVEKIEILNKLGLDVFIFDYRGYGRSGGRPSEKGLYRDAEVAYDYLVSQKGVSPERIILYGESLGGAVALDLAGKRDTRAVITESALSSTMDTARTIYPFLPTFLLSSKFDSVRKIRDVKVPKLIIHSKNDEIIPFNQSIKLVDASPEPKRHLVLMGSHNTCFLDSRDLYISGINGFLKGL